MLIEPPWSCKLLIGCCLSRNKRLSAGFTGYRIMLEEQLYYWSWASQPLSWRWRQLQGWASLDALHILVHVRGMRHNCFMCGKDRLMGHNAFHCHMTACGLRLDLNAWIKFSHINAVAVGIAQCTSVQRVPYGSKMKMRCTPCWQPSGLTEGQSSGKVYSNQSSVVAIKSERMEHLLCMHAKSMEGNQHIRAFHAQGRQCCTNVPIKLIGLVAVQALWLLQYGSLHAKHPLFHSSRRLRQQRVSSCVGLSPSFRCCLPCN